MRIPKLLAATETFIHLLASGECKHYDKGIIRTYTCRSQNSVHKKRRAVCGTSLNQPVEEVIFMECGEKSCVVLDIRGKEFSQQRVV